MFICPGRLFNIRRDQTSEAASSSSNKELNRFFQDVYMLYVNHKPVQCSNWVNRGLSMYLLVTHNVSLQYLPVSLVTVVDKEAVEPLAGLCDSVPAG